MSNIIGKYNEWVEQGAVLTPEAIRRIAAIMREDAKPRLAKKGTFRGSMIGDPCARKLKLNYLGYAEYGDGAQIPLIGTWGHYRWQGAGLSHGFLTDVEVKVRGRNFSGTADGTTDDGRLFELKTTNHSVMKTLRNSDHPVDDMPRMHFMQVQAYMEYGGWNDAVVVYEERAFGEHFLVEVERDEEIGDQIRTEIRSWVKNRRHLPLMHPGCIAGSDMRQYCNVREECLVRWGAEFTGEDRS